MVVRINIKYLMYMYNHKMLAPRTISRSVQNIYNKIQPSDVYTKFIFYIFFCDVNINCQPPSCLCELLKHTKIIEFIKKNLFRQNENRKIASNDVHCSEICKIEKLESQNTIFEIINFLLTIELNIENLYICNKNFFVDLISQMSSQTQKSVLNLKFKISPILVRILKNLLEKSTETDFESKNFLSEIPEIYRDFCIFIKSTKLNFYDGFREIDKFNLNYRKLENQILTSKFSSINEYHSAFVNFFPEIIFSTKIYKNRLFYFDNPLNLPLEHKILSSQIMANLYYMKIINPKLDIPNFDVLYKLIYLERMLQKGLTKKMCYLIHQFILDNHILIYILLKRKFDINCVEVLVNYIPSFHLGFDISFKLYLNTNDTFYLFVIKTLLRKYKVKEYFKCLKDSSSKFPSDFIAKYKKYLDES